IGVHLPPVSAQQREGRRGPPPLPTMEQLPQEVATLKQLIPTNSTIMMDVQWHWTNLWWAGKKRNWPLAQYYFNESRGHIQQLVRKNPTIRNQGTTPTWSCRAFSTGSTPVVWRWSRARSRRRTLWGSRRTTERCSRAVIPATRVLDDRTSARRFRRLRCRRWSTWIP